MAVTPTARDRAAPYLRQMLCRQLGIIPFPHQAGLWLALDGYELGGIVAQWDSIEAYKESDSAFGWRVGLTQDVLIGHESGSVDLSWVERRALAPRVIPARRAATLAAYKAAKSHGAAMYVTPELLLDGVQWDLVGMEYDVCDAEWSYFMEFLFSEKGLNLPLKKPDHPGLYSVSLLNKPNLGRMRVELSNGSVLQARSYSAGPSEDPLRALKGKQRDGYLFSEYYQFPNITVFTDIKQNLQARNGKALFPTTPDSAQVETLEDLGQDDTTPEWYCESGIHRSQNPYTFDPHEMEQDRRIMTREKFSISYEGKLGKYVGSCFEYTPGDWTFTPETHPDMWKAPTDRSAKLDKDGNVMAVPANLDVPLHWLREGGADTGTNFAALQAVADEQGRVFYIFEYPNYRYVSGVRERDEKVSIASWAGALHAGERLIGGRWTYVADKNTQFAGEMHHHRVTLVRDKMDPELRTEVLRVLIREGKAWFAPWLKVLLQELVAARFPPEESTATGKKRRIKKNDELVDCAEHIAVQHPIAKRLADPETPHPLDELRVFQPHKDVDPHMGGGWV